MNPFSLINLSVISLILFYVAHGFNHGRRHSNDEWTVTRMGNGRVEVYLKEDNPELSQFVIGMARLANEYQANRNKRQVEREGEDDETTRDDDEDRRPSDGGQIPRPASPPPVDSDDDETTEIDTKYDVFRGRFLLNRSENVDAFLNEVGLSQIMIQLAKLIHPVIEFRNHGEKFQMIVSTRFVAIAINFRLGEEFDVRRFDGAKVRTKFVADGNKLVQTVNDGNRTGTTVLEFNGDHIKETSKLNNVIMTRWYNRID